MRLMGWRLGLIAALAGVLVLLLLVGETAARFLGFGDPPLAQRDALTEYRMVPNREYRRFGNRIAINRHGMRSDDFDAARQPAATHLLLVGDSVVYGEHQVDQSQTLAALWQQSLRSREGQGGPWLVSAAAVSSWGPANELAYLQAAGPFQAERAVLVVSSHDLWDAPTGLDSDLPYRQQAPWGALHDLALALWERRVRAAAPAAAPAAQPTELAALRRLMDFLVARHGQLWVVFHPAHHELQAPAGSLGAQAEQQVAQLAAQAGARFASAQAPYAAAQQQGLAVYRDGLHLTAQGNRVLVEWLDNWVRPWEGNGRAAAPR
jgi:hypothetical protein